MPFSISANILADRPKDYTLHITAAGVAIMHGLLLILVVLTHSEIKPIPLSSPSRLVVQTVALTPKTQVSDSKRLKEPVAPKEKVIPEIAKEEEPVKIVEKEAVAATDIPKDEKAVIPVEIPKMLEESIPAPVEPIKEAPVEKEIKNIEEPKKVEESIKAKTPEVHVKKAPPKKIEPKKAEVKKVEKPAATKAVTTKKTTPVQKSEAIKKNTPVVKSGQAATPVSTQNIKKSEADKAAAERQKKIDAEQQAAKAKLQNLVSQAQETIAKIDKSRDKISRANFSDSEFVKSPGTIGSLQIDSLPEKGSRQQLSPQEASYHDELASRLKLGLTLPDYGEVKIKLVLERSGKVAKVEIVSAASVANKQYIEKTIKNLTFPPFGANFGQSPQFTFSIVLCNEM